MDNDLRFTDKDGSCIARSNLVIAFFGKKQFAEIVDGARYCVDQYLKLLPKDALKWSVIGSASGTHKPILEKSIARCRSMLNVASARKKDIHFRLLGPEKYAPDYSLVLNGRKEPSDEGFLDQASVIEMRFPAAYLDEIGEESFVAFVVDLFEQIACDSGYASFSLCYGKESQYAKAGDHIAPLAFRSHGFDIANNLFTSGFLGNHCRGARWLTALSDDLIADLGGVDALNDQVAAGVDLITCAGGTVLRAGRSPEIGDVNRNAMTPLVESVAHAIEEVTYFGDKSLLPLFGQDLEKLDRWERRFWIHS